MFLHSFEKGGKKIRRKDINENVKCRNLLALGVISLQH